MLHAPFAYRQICLSLLSKRPGTHLASSGYRDRTLPYHSTCYQDGIKSLDGSSAGLYTGQRGYRGTYTSQTAPCISNDTNRDTNLNTNHNTNQIVGRCPSRLNLRFQSLAVVKQYGSSRRSRQKIVGAYNHLITTLRADASKEYI